MDGFTVLEDGQTAGQKRIGKTLEKFPPIFGEQILYAALGNEGEKDDADKEMHYGRYVGKHEGQRSVLVLTPDGGKKGFSYLRLADGKG